MADLHAAADVVFDFAAADDLITASTGAARAIREQVPGRVAAVTTGATDFRGRFAGIFAANARAAASDGAQLATQLDLLATAVGKLKVAAAEEQRRRDKVNAWLTEHADEGHSLWGGTDRPNLNPEPQPDLSVSAPPSTPREPMNPGGRDTSSTTSGTGSSSARPSNLRSFAASIAGADDALQPHLANVVSNLVAFSVRCQFGTLDASGVLIGFTSWLQGNAQDTVWAAVVAAAFTAAGGKGRMATLSDATLATVLSRSELPLSRQPMLISSPVLQGVPQSTGWADDPVNAATGNFVEVESDLGFPGTSSRLELTRCYNSFDADPLHAYGPGWSSIADAGLRFETAGSRFRLPEGREVVFPRLGTGWDRAVGEALWLSADEQGLRVSGNDGSWWRFSTAGVLDSYGLGAESGPEKVNLDRDSAGRLVRLVHGRGRWIALSWAHDRIVSATTSDGRSAVYGYDDDGRLIAVATALGIRTYRWSDDILSAVVDADGVVEVDNAYDDQRRVVAQRSPYGRTSFYSYLPGPSGAVTVVSDEDGTRSNTWISDDRGRLIGVLDAADERQSMSYDGFGNKVLVTDRGGGTTVHEYDWRGRRIRTVQPEGAEFSYGWDDLDRVTTVSANSSVTTYRYVDEARNPCEITDPEGGVTRLTWEHGLLRQLTDPTGVVVRFGYDDFGDLVAVTDADGHTARTERDALGRVTATLTPSGARTEYRYDDVTQLLVAVTTPDGAVCSYEHTAAGRLVATVDPLGHRTRVEHGPHGEVVRSIDPLGRSVSRQLDDLGNLARVELPDGSTWQFSHDALSRLTETIDPTGGRWRRTYDQLGLPTGATDPTGVQVALGTGPLGVWMDEGEGPIRAALDPLGRLTSLTDVDGSQSRLVYDRCGRVVESLDAEGGLTRTVRDPAGRPVTVIGPTGAATHFGYNRSGRLASVTDPLGAVTEIDYNADGRPVVQTLPTGEVAWTRYDACGRVVEHHQPGAGTIGYTYDLAGRVVQTVDPSNGQRRFDYDAAGQLIAATDANGGVTHYRYDANGRAVEIVTPVGGVIRREFDAMNRCVAETDPLGRTTRAGYDAAGRIAWQTEPSGHRRTWTYDANGRVVSVAVDDQVLSTTNRDVRNRTEHITDTSGNRTVEHVLKWNRRGQLVRRSRDGRAVQWTYDAAGNRTSMTTPDGKLTRYSRDAAGRTMAVEHPDLGRAAFDRDAAGRVVAATAGGVRQTWSYADGFVVGHTLGDTVTTIERDHTGRIRQIVRDGVGGPEFTSYAYDAACQLTGARIGNRRGTTHQSWSYDRGGRLVTETQDGHKTAHTYDLAGQLLESVSATEHTTYVYDAVGRRVCSDGPGGHREFSWGLSGFLAGVNDAGGTIEFHTDALGELARVDDREFFWDTAGFVGAPVLAGETNVLSAGPVTGIGREWTAPGWRTQRSSETWGTASAGAGVTIGAAGEISVAGLELMGARAYDPGTRGFLSVDSLEPTVGASWAANPYSYAGNDPLHALDPHGLHPLTDAELTSYNDNNGIGGFLKDNYEYVAGGAAVLAGGILCATGIGGPAGVMLISGGVNVIMQKATTGSVNWLEAGAATATGAIGGGAFLAGKLGVTGAKAVLFNSAVAGGISGGVTSGASYLGSPGPHTVGGFATAVGLGTVVGSAMGTAGGSAGVGLKAGLRAIMQSHVGLGAVKLLNTVLSKPPAPAAVSAAPDLDYLYRGLAPDHPKFADAQQGIATPFGGHSDPVSHNDGNTYSQFTSWTTDSDLARGIADGGGGRGVVLRIPNADGPGYTRVSSPDIYFENEVLIQGTVHGAEVMR